MQARKAGRRKGGQGPMHRASKRALERPPFFGYRDARTMVDLRYFGVACEKPDRDAKVLSNGSTTVLGIDTEGDTNVPRSLYAMTPAKRSPEDKLRVDEVGGKIRYRMLLSQEKYHIDPDTPLYLMMVVLDQPVRLHFNGAYRFKIGEKRVAVLLPLDMPTVDEPEKKTHVSIRLEEKTIAIAEVILTRTEKGILFNYNHNRDPAAESARVLIIKP